MPHLVLQLGRAPRPALSRRRAGRDYTRGWPDEVVLAWLPHWGTVRTLPFTHAGGAVLSSFVSPANRATAFSLTGAGRHVYVPSPCPFC